MRWVAWVRAQKEVSKPRSQAAHWVTELSQSLEFQPVIAYSFARPGHINVLESRTYKTLLKLQSIQNPDTRSVVLLDSQVTQGANAKGRSSSPALARVQQGSLGYIMGGNLYPAGIYTHSADHRADDPTRNRRIRLPCI